MAPPPPMRASALLKHNIASLLRARHLSRKDLAQWCHRTESWISKIYRSPTREFPLKYLDRIADFFGLATYQLFQPGISETTERRSVTDRRVRRDRRIGHQMREMIATSQEVRRARGVTLSGGGTTDAPTVEVSETATVDQALGDFQTAIAEVREKIRGSRPTRSPARDRADEPAASPRPEDGRKRPRRKAAS